MTRLNISEIRRACDPEPEHMRRTRSSKKPKKLTSTSVPRDGIMRFTEKGSPVRIFASEMEQGAWRQASAFADLPFLHPEGMVLMPDVHEGKFVPVGSVLPTLGVLVPAAVGVDIGCGMVAARLNITARDLPKNLRTLRNRIEEFVPMGGSFHSKHSSFVHPSPWDSLSLSYEKLCSEHPKIRHSSPSFHLGTLGSGNHFIEICLSETSDVWVMAHSGSRGPGAFVGQYFIDAALRRIKENGIFGQGFGWLHDDDPLFSSYVESVEWAQNFASLNRKMMLEMTIKAISEHTPKTVSIVEKAVSCHHNYIARENHFGQDVWVTRKGAVSAQKGEFAIIPGAMGQKSFIVRGKGSQVSYCSCSHGAGRKMSRSKAKEMFTAKDLKSSLASVECRKDRKIVDEIPLAYKNLDRVMADQKDLVEVVHTLKAVLCCKGI